MSKPKTEPDQSRGASLERSREQILAAARPLPPIEEMVIEDLTDDDSRRFLEAIFDA